jgi:hypothetical protein
MNVATLILQLQQMAHPHDEVTLIVEEPTHSSIHGMGIIVHTGIFSGKVIGTGTGAEDGKCEVYGLG